MAFACMSGGCLFQAPVDFEPAAAMRAIINHLATEHPAITPRAREPGLRPPALLHSTVDIGRSPAHWANLLSRGSRFDSECNFPTLQRTTRAIGCFTGKPISTADKAILCIGSSSIAGLVSQVKPVAALPVAMGILRSTAHLAKKSSGEGSQMLAAKAHGLTANNDYVATQAQACTTAGTKMARASFTHHKS